MLFLFHQQLLYPIIKNMGNITVDLFFSDFVKLYLTIIFYLNY